MKRQLAVLLISGGFSLGALAQTGLSEPPDDEPVGLTMDRFEQLDQAGDGHVTREEAQSDEDLATQFNDIDKDGDGRLTQAEFAAFLVETQQDPQAQEYLDREGEGSTSEQQRPEPGT